MAYLRDHLTTASLGQKLSAEAKAKPGKGTKATTFADGPGISAGDTCKTISDADSFILWIIRADAHALQISEADE